MDMSKFQWTREPESYKVSDGKVTITTKPHTDLWQRTYYHFRNDNAPVFQMETEEQYFSFVVKTSFEDSHQRFDQCPGIFRWIGDGIDTSLKGIAPSQRQHLQRRWRQCHTG